MCVIINIENGEFPKYQTLKEAEILNSHGGSIAWLENGKINYQKGIKAKKVNELIEKRLKPNKVKTAIIHFRIASVGNVNKDLCHPFPISNEVKTDLKIEDSKFDLLFHNGTISNWENMLIESLQKNFGKLPQGELSDSRAIAFLLNRHGTDIIKDSKHNKFSILTKKGIIKFGTWVKVDKNECSNDYFVKNDYEYNYLGFWDKTETKKEVSKKEKTKGKKGKKGKLPNFAKQKLRSNWENDYSDDQNEINKFIKTIQDRNYYQKCKKDFYVTDQEILENLENGLTMIDIYDLFNSSMENKKTWINGDFQPANQEIWYNDDLEKLV